MEPGGLRAHFQPIFERRGEALEIHSMECLMRGPKGSNLERADILFEYVRLKRAESLVDPACIATGLRQAALLPPGIRLALNVHASTLARDQSFPTFLADCASRNRILVSRLTVEIVEHSPAWDGPRFLKAIEELREMGVEIALDDVGLGQSNYRMILDCKPDYFKIDRYFVHGIRWDFFRQAIVQSVALLAKKFGARVVAEGIERQEDLDAVLNLGIDLLQGYLLGVAEPAPAGGTLHPVHSVQSSGLESRHDFPPE
jgi:EAL domain-containing protein (putative c-di-GMP-specific phosphodiesterase class I)